MLRRHDPGPGRARSCPMPRTTAEPGRAACHRSCWRPWTCRRRRASPAPGHRGRGDRAAGRLRGPATADGQARTRSRSRCRSASTRSTITSLSAQVQVRPRPAGAARPAPRDHLRRCAAQGRPALPSAPRQGTGHDRGRTRGLPSPSPGRTRGSSAASTRRRGSKPVVRRSGGSGTAQLEPGAVIPTYVEREFSFQLGGDRVRGRWDRVDVGPLDAGRSADLVAAPTPWPEASADVVSPTLDMLGPERVTITDYKSSDVRDR